MKHYTRKTKKIIFGLKVSLLILMVVLIPSFLFYIVSEYEKVGAFSYETPPDSSSFMRANESQLAEVAYYLDDRFVQYHLPLNLSSSTVFVNDSAYNGGEVSYTNVSYYVFGDNEALWTGTDFVGWVYKYLSARQEGNKTMEAFAKETLIKMTHGLSMLMAVPNGGLGREYGGILARGYCPADKRDVWPHLFEDHPKHFNGTGPYKNWRWRGYTSNDEFGGYYMALALATKYLRHIPYINDTIALIVDQLCYNMLKNNFLGIHGTGALTGVDQKPRMGYGGFWVPLLLKMGSLYFPERYERIYLHYALNEMYYMSAREGGAQEAIANYYALHFGTCVVFSYLLLENSSNELWWKFFNGYLESTWHDTRFHRNAFFNAVFLMICHEQGISNEWFAQRNRWENFTEIADDVKDQLQRFALYKFPVRWYPINNTLPEGYSLISPQQEFLDRTNLPPYLVKLLGIRPESKFTNKALTCEYLPNVGWIWNDNPFYFQSYYPGNPLFESSGGSFFVPYWMMRYMGYISPGGDLHE